MASKIIITTAVTSFATPCYRSGSEGDEVPIHTTAQEACFFYRHATWKDIAATRVTREYYTHKSRILEGATRAPPRQGVHIPYH